MRKKWAAVLVFRHCWYFSKTRYLPKALSHALFTALVGIFLDYGKRYQQKYQQKMLLALDAL
ncbi:hypothetical protein [Suttonella indologenes]|uniref:hypothetical protein n=1 Tax=Suttonella indologenes TaxID=13276 RepID=UPI0015587698|nr:hypothetical protein [Suttonella indologenes]